MSETSSKTTNVKQILASNHINENVIVKGWVRFFRSNRFIIINDGSTIHNIQAVLDLEKVKPEETKHISVGACIAVAGKLAQSAGSGQAVEILVDSFEVLGKADPEKYPLQPKKHSLEFLREIGHLRPRTNTFSAVLRLRHSMTFAIHNFFNERGFFNVHTPIITGSDCEGAGEMFRVTILDPKNPPLKDDGTVDFKQDFFGKETNLTVSGQLNGELAAMALGKIYTFGPTFRAENSNTSRHLAEFWMIEPEVAFNEIKENMDLAEDFIKYLIKYALDHNRDDIEFLKQRLLEEEKDKPKEQRQEMDLIQKLEFVLAHNFERITYTDAVQILKDSKPNKTGKFQYPVGNWGFDMQSEHEKYLVEKHFKKPVIVTNYPREIKAFYMKQNDDGKTVAAMDVLVPGIGEIIGGSQREENYDKLLEAVKRFNIPEKDIWWYLDTRRFGTAPHAGFGLGFERLMLFITGMGNIRDVIPFPRAPKTAEF
jgi:asparaginyl-tRNA synthetase